MPVNYYLVPLVTCTLTDAIVCLDTVLICYCLFSTINVIITIEFWGFTWYSVVEEIQRRRLSWFGHISRMEIDRLPARALYRHVTGECSQGRQAKKWIENINGDFELRNIQFKDAVATCKDRTPWRQLISSTSSSSWWQTRKKKKKKKCCIYFTSDQYIAALHTSIGTGTAGIARGQYHWILGALLGIILSYTLSIVTY